MNRLKRLQDQYLFIRGIVLTNMIASDYCLRVDECPLLGRDCTDAAGEQESLDQEEAVAALRKLRSGAAHQNTQHN